jgi:pyrroline-5-carboxylate reductase
MLFLGCLTIFIWLKMSSAILTDKVVGFVGTGKISSCLVRGYCSAGDGGRPAKVLVSPRNADKAAALQKDYPDLVEIGTDNEDVVRRSDVVFVGLLPKVAREVLPKLPFGGDNSGKLVISMMAAIMIEELCGLVDVPNTQIIRTVPLPSAARREGPILSHPPNAACEEVLRVVGTPVACAEEKEMTPLVCLTGHISPFFELMRTTESYMTDNGVDAKVARKYVSSFYSALARGTEVTVDTDTLAEMTEEAATPGGINEQALEYLQGTDHFELQTASLGRVMDRLQGRLTYVPKHER